MWLLIFIIAGGLYFQNHYYTEQKNVREAKETATQDLVTLDEYWNKHYVDLDKNAREYYDTYYKTICSLSHGKNVELKMKDGANGNIVCNPNTFGAKGDKTISIDINK